MNIAWKYVKANWLYALVIAYGLFSCILKIFTGINITIPCIFRTFFHLRCPGCGLTAAFIHLLQLRFSEAWEHNPMIFLVLPLGAFCLYMSFRRFRKRVERLTLSETN